MRTPLRSRILPLALAAALIAACASKPEIRSNLDPTADFSKYRTFAFYDEATGRKAAYESFGNQYIKTAIAREMQARGLQQAGDAPDLLVNIHVETKDKVRVSETPSAGYGYYGYRGGMYGWGAGVSTTVDNYTEGTLNIDVIDRAASKLLWEGIAIGRINSKARDNPQPAIDAVVKQVFERFPTQPPQPAGEPS
jgi:Domain of unknown function (DUF4136)